MSDLKELYRACGLCPQHCGVNRLAGETGVCGETSQMRLASACIHYGEEPPLTGESGSGTVFFTGCTLHCPFCQNYQISQKGTGGIVSESVLADIFIDLERRGAANINLVTGTHFTPGIIASIGLARGRGLSIPVVWNSSGYEKPETIRALAPYVDIWLPDMKTFDRELARSLFDTDDYPDTNKAALLLMTELSPPRWEGEILVRGVIVRHLILPGRPGSTTETLRWFRDNLKGKAYLSLMCQFIPMHRSSCADGSPLRVVEGVVTDEEYGGAMFLLDELGIDDGFIQEPAGDTDWTPDFTQENPFPVKFAVPVWHYRSGTIGR